VKEWVQKQLKALARLFGKLAEKLGAALPGIIGNIISWFLNLLKKSALFIAEHVWLFIVFVVGLTGSWLLKKVNSKNK
jgi:hypothetical protein